MLNKILNETKPFNAPVESMLNENFNDMDKTLKFDGNIAQAGVEGVRTQMAAKMGYGDMTAPQKPNGGLGVSTGLSGLDRILNRDNSDLVSKFKTR